MGAQEWESVDFENACMDLVSERKYEPFVEVLLTKRRRGEWHPVPRLCEETASPVAGLSEASHLFVTWLDDPSGDPSFALILFYDDDSKRTAGAQYNRARLLRAPGETSPADGYRERSPTR